MRRIRIKRSEKTDLWQQGYDKGIADATAAAKKAFKNEIAKLDAMLNVMADDDIRKDEKIKQQAERISMLESKLRKAKMQRSVREASRNCIKEQSHADTVLSNRRRLPSNVYLEDPYEEAPDETD